jgi:hypothetical protein
MNWLDSALEDLGKPADGVRSPPPARAAPLHLRPVTGWHSSTRTSEPRPNAERSSWSTTPRLSGVSSPSPRLDQVIPHFQSLEDALEAARERGGCLPRPVRRFHAERGRPLHPLTARAGPRISLPAGAPVSTGLLRWLGRNGLAPGGLGRRMLADGRYGTGRRSPRIGLATSLRPWI